MGQAVTVPIVWPWRGSDRQHRSDHSRERIPREEFMTPRLRFSEPETAQKSYGFPVANGDEK